jgi:hypothetical protein
MALHDCSQGLDFWRFAVDAEAHGNIIYYNGYQDTDRGHGHGIYTQNETGVKTIGDNIIFDQFGLGIQAYGSSAAFVRNYRLEGNIVFNNGSIARGISKVDNILFAVGSVLQNIVLDRNYTYHTPSDNDGYSRLGWQFGGTSDDVVATNNYWIGGESSIEVWKWNRATFTGNTIYSQTGLLATLDLTSGQSTSNYQWNNNHYFGSGIFRFQSSNHNWSNWKTNARVDSASTYTPGRPTGVWVFVRPNKYEAGRANVAVYNWDFRSSVAADMSAVLKSGESYEVRDAQNFFGAPVASGVYSGGSISIPMTSTAKSTAIGAIPTPPRHTGLEFGAFVVIKR